MKTLERLEESDDDKMSYMKLKFMVTRNLIKTSISKPFWHRKLVLFPLLYSNKTMQVDCLGVTLILQFIVSAGKQPWHRRVRTVQRDLS